MNKILFALFSVLLFLSACKKDDDRVFEKSPDQRLNEQLASYQTLLAGAEDGWKALITLDSGRSATYSFYFKFNNENRVTMLSDFDSASAVTPRESSFRLKALQQPSLLFDTYSYLHVLSDPDAAVNGGSYGVGLSADFEFFFSSANADSIQLIGRFNGSKAVLVKATKAEGDAYNSGRLARGLSINKILTYFKRLTVGSQVFDVQVNPVNRTVTFTWIDAAGAVKTFITNFFLTIEGITLTKPLQVGSLTITTLTNMNFNNATQSVDLKINTENASISGIVVPLAVDINAPSRWYNAATTADTYWFSVNGFHVNGVDDAYNVRDLQGDNFPYYYYIYYPKFGPNYDFFGPIFLNAAANQLELVYGSAPRVPTFTSDGRAVFTEFGAFGNHPTTGGAFQSLLNLYSTRGFYFVQTGPNTYDMVSATDGKSWISWQM